MSKAIPPAVAAYTLEGRQRLLDRIAQLEGQLQHWLSLDKQRSAELDACCAALPGTLYMDPPDGGDVPVAEQLRRMGEDAARWRAVMQYGEGSAFEWLTAKYVQRADERQAAIGLQYTEAETHDLAKSVMLWLRHCTLADYGFQPVAMPPTPGPLEPEGPNVPTYRQRAEDVYFALQAKLGSGPLGHCNYRFDKVEVEALMGLLSHRFEGVW